MCIKLFTIDNCRYLLFSVVVRMVLGSVVVVFLFCLGVLLIADVVDWY